MTTRRTFLKTSSLATMAAMSHQVLAPVSLRHSPTRPSPLGPLPGATDPQQLKEMAMRALDAAKAAGASYADVRFTTTQRRRMDGYQPEDYEARAVGVRALANGAWGFSAHTEWSAELLPRLGRQAAEQAKMVAWPRVPPIRLTDHPSAATGTWSTPIKRDPFTVPIEEISEWMNRAYKAMQQGGAMGALITLTFERQERVFASTAGAYTTQTVYTSLGSTPHRDVHPTGLVITVRGKGNIGLLLVDGAFTPVGAGYEALEETKVLDHAAIWAQKAGRLLAAPAFEAFGEYDVVLDGAAMTQLVDKTLGTALEYDRAVGYEGDTSYLAPPLEILGTTVAPSTVTVTGDRTLAQGTATVGWDDEGIAPKPFPLIKDGVVVDYATSREFVAELAPWYQRQNVPAASNGCSTSESAFVVPMVGVPNLVMHPAAQDTSLTALVSGIENGYLFCGGKVQMNPELSSGLGTSDEVYTIRHGKIGPPVSKATYRFLSRNLWKHLEALGGPATSMVRGTMTSKGEPDQTTYHSVQAPAAHFSKVQIYNTDRA